MIRIAQPYIGEEEEQAVLATLRSGRLAQGPRVAEFEAAFAEYLGARHAVAVSSGTAALVIALQAHGIGEDDEVLVPAFTFAASANAVLLAGARPVLTDIRADDFTIDIASAEAAATSRTRAIIPVHLFGHPCDTTALRSFAEARDLLIVEDACQAIGASWGGDVIGSRGTACFSFYATKSITTGEGGMVVTDDDRVAEQARILRNQGEETRYVTSLLSGNSRMTEIAAALGLAQLPKLDGWNERRRANAAWLNDHLTEVVTPQEGKYAHHVYQQYTVRVSTSIPGDRLQPVAGWAEARPSKRSGRDALSDSLREQGIEAIPYYQRCIHQQPLYQKLGIGGSFPVAERAAQEVLSLPIHPALTQSNLEAIATAVNGARTLSGVHRG